MSISLFAYPNPELVAEKLVKETRPGDVILFKANPVIPGKYIREQKWSL